MKTKTFQCNKLVRDKTLERLHAQGGSTRHFVLKNEELETALKKKLLEEVDEFLCATDQSERAAEFADVLEVLDALRHFYALSLADINQKKQDRFDARGGFFDGIFLQTMKLPLDSPMGKYCQKNINRYPETEE